MITDHIYVSRRKLSERIPALFRIGGVTVIILFLSLSTYGILKIRSFIALQKYLSEATTIESLSEDDVVFSNLIKDTALDYDFTGEGGTEIEIPDLKLYSYNINEGDSLWNVAQKTGLSMDTIILLDFKMQTG